MRNHVIASEQNAVRYFQACCCLHNFLRTENDKLYFNADTDIDDKGELIITDKANVLDQLRSVRDEKNNHPVVAATRSRELLCEFVNGVGAVSWQNDIFWVEKNVHFRNLNLLLRGESDRRHDIESNL